MTDGATGGWFDARVVVGTHPRSLLPATDLAAHLERFALSGALVSAMASWLRAVEADLADDLRAEADLLLLADARLALLPLVEVLAVGMTISGWIPAARGALRG